MRGLGTAIGAVALALVAGTADARADAAPCGGAPVPATFTSGPWHGEELERREVHRSAPTASYASWAGLWEMPDRSLMIGFTQALGPVDPAQREAGPLELKERLGTADKPASFDFWGLQLSTEYLRSRDGGRAFAPWRSDPFKALYPHPYAAAATTVLPDGTLLRRVAGWDLQHDATVPHTAFLQRLAPGASEWSAPEVLLDPATSTYQISRFRRLRDGCLLALGQVWEAPAGVSRAELARAPSALLLLVSADHGQTWIRNPVTVPEGEAYVKPNEWDVAELPSGDLLAVFRTVESEDSRTQVRRQGLLARSGLGWTLTHVRDSPLAHSGHPELLATREGLILHVATDGVSWTGDGGATWKPLAFHPEWPYTSRYYPVSLQARDGTVHVVSHSGADSGYGVQDQVITADRFRITDVPPPPPPPADRFPGGAQPGDRAVPGTTRIPVTLTTTVRAAGRRVTVRGRLHRAQRAGALAGRVRLRFTHGRHGVRRASVAAAPRFTRTVRLPRAGRWKLRVAYRGGGGYAAARIGPALVRVR